MSINKNTSVNPKICGLSYVLKSEIKEATIKYAPDINGISFDLEDEKQWKDLYYSETSITFQEPTELSDAGLIYKPVMSLYFPGLTTTQEVELNKLINQPAVFLLEYTDGNKLVVGNYYEPAKLIPAFNSNPDFTGISFTIAAICSQKSRFLVVL